MGGTAGLVVRIIFNTLELNNSILRCNQSKGIQLKFVDINGYFFNFVPDVPDISFYDFLLQLIKFLKND
jgi:hypothetical protein